MRSFVQSILISTLVLLSITSLEAFPVKTRVVVQNLSDKTIRIHCKSSENDLGVHDLVYQQYFSWHFRPNFWRTTSFDCDIQTVYGSGYYNVFNNDKDTVCGPECVWMVSNSGPCLVINPRGGKGLCEDWQTKPNSHRKFGI